MALATLLAMFSAAMPLHAQEAIPDAPAVPAPARGAASRGTGGRAAAPTGGGRTASPGGGFTGGRGGGFSGGTPPGSFGGGPSSPRPTVSTSHVATDGPSTTFNATIYSVRLPLDQISRMEVDALTKAADTPADFEKALAALGSVHPLYHVDQSVRLQGDQVVVGTSVPYITNSQITQTHQTVNSVSYSQVGARFGISGSATPAGGMNVDLSIQVSVKADSDTAISDSVKAPNFQSSVMSHEGPVKPGQPFVVMSVDAGSSGTSGMGSARIARVVFGAPE